MGYEATKTERAGAKHGNGANWRPKKEAKQGSNKLRRRNNKRAVHEAEPDLDELLASLTCPQDLLTKLREKKYQITKAIAQSTDQFHTGRYEGPD